MQRESFVFYKSFYEAIRKIENKELKADIYEAVCELGLNENVVPLDNNVGQIIMELITPQITVNNYKYSNSLSGGRPKKYDEKEIVNLIINENLGNVEISRKIGCSVSTVKNIKTRLLSGNWRQKPNVNDNDNVNAEEEKEENIFVFLETNFGYCIPPLQMQSLQNWLGEFNGNSEIIRFAITKCCNNNVRTFSYLEGILQAWKSKGFKTLEECKNEIKAKKTTENIPEWMDKTVEKKEASNEEKKKIEELLKEYK